MTLVIGLTGSIGMGKSTTAQMFKEEGIPVWDADAAVAQIYDRHGSAVGPMAQLDETLVVDGGVSKDRIKQLIKTQPDLLKRIEAIVHPLVADHRQQFLTETKAPIVVLDVPLLFETGLNDRVEVTVCVSTDSVTQKSRVLARGTMTEADFELILSKQMPDADKRARADFVIETNTVPKARQQVKALLETLEGRLNA